MFHGQGYTGKAPENASVHGALQVGLGGVQAVHLESIIKRFLTNSKNIFSQFPPHLSVPSLAHLLPHHTSPASHVENLGHFLIMLSVEILCFQHFILPRMSGKWFD